MKVIAAVMEKGGAGKTSTIVPLAWRAWRRGHRVAVIDLDWDAESEGSASQWIETANLASETFVSEQVRLDALPDLLQQVREAGGVDYVFIDTSPRNRHASVEAMSESDLVIMPMHIGSGDIAQLVATWKLMRRPLKTNPNLQHLVLLNHAGTQPRVTRETREAVQAVLPDAVIAQTAIPYRVEYSTAKGNVPDGLVPFESLWKEVEAML